MNKIEKGHSERKRTAPMHQGRHDTGGRGGGRAVTKQERIIVSAYTGVLMCDFGDMHQYIEEKLGLPVWTHEIADKAVWDELKEAIKPDFLVLCSTD